MGKANLGFLLCRLGLLTFPLLHAELTEKYGSSITSCDVLSYAMYPDVYTEFREFTEKYGDLS